MGHLGSFLGLFLVLRFLLRFKEMLEPFGGCFVGPRVGKSKHFAREWCKFRHFSPFRFGVGFGRPPGPVWRPVWSPNWAPKGLQTSSGNHLENEVRKETPQDPDLGPTWPQHGPPKGPETGQKFPRTPSRTPPGRPQQGHDAAKRRQEPFWSDFEPIWDRFGAVFGPISARFLDPLKDAFGLVLDRFGSPRPPQNIPEDFPMHPPTPNKGRGGASRSAGTIRRAP